MEAGAAAVRGVSPNTLNESLTTAGPPPLRVFRHSMSDSSGNSSPASHRNGKIEGRSPRFSEEYYKDASDEEEMNNPEKKEKKRKFLEMRKKHYQMKEALLKM